jgi:hypothetical protein
LTSTKRYNVCEEYPSKTPFLVLEVTNGDGGFWRVRIERIGSMVSD